MYKVIIFTILLFPTINFCIAQNNQSEIFKTVKNNFAKMYPDAQEVEWQLEKDNIYEAEFIQKGLEYEAEYTIEGQWISTEREVEVNEIPSPVMESIHASEWASWEIDEVEELSSPGRDKYYEIEIEQNDEDLYLYYSLNGDLIEQSQTSKILK